MPSMTDTSLAQRILQKLLDDGLIGANGLVYQELQELIHQHNGTTVKADPVRALIEESRRAAEVLSMAAHPHESPHKKPLMDAAAAAESALAQQTSHRNPWQQAVDQGRVAAHLGIAGDGVTDEQAVEQLGELIDWHIAVATDPTVNGGFKLVPAQQTEAPAQKARAKQGEGR